DDDPRMTGQAAELNEQLEVVAAELSELLLEVRVRGQVVALRRGGADLQDGRPLQVIGADADDNHGRVPHLTQRVDLRRNLQPALRLRTQQAVRDRGAVTGQVQRSPAVDAGEIHGVGL